jgi:excisionase family DNA binding protein
MATPFLVTREVADRLRCSVRTVHELTRLGRIPHRRLSGARRCLFLVNELEAWENGASLELFELSQGGRIVRPLPSDSYSIRTPVLESAANDNRVRADWD